MVLSLLIAVLATACGGGGGGGGGGGSASVSEEDMSDPGGNEPEPTTPSEEITCDDYDELRTAYFGDTHTHTTFSFDAFAFGVRLTPGDALRFARGEQVGLTPYNDLGEPLRRTQLTRPLDWTMLSDHAELFGEATLCTDSSFEQYSSPQCAIYRQQDSDSGIFFASLMVQAREMVERLSFCGEGGALCEAQAPTIMAEHIAAAERENEDSGDCTFTAFIGYEWTGSPTLEETGESQNIHRNVMFANATVPELPISYLDAPYPEDLWDRLNSDCIEALPGCDVVTIPHNSNLSAGLMFEQRDRAGRPYSAEYATLRARFEPVVEIFQHKGSSECQAGGADAQCEFESIPWGDLLLGYSASAGSPDANPGLPRPNAFVRDALREGLALATDLEINPFKYGFIGSTDSHMGTPGLVEEDRYPGHYGWRFNTGADVDRAQFVDDPHNNPGGIAVTWARQNSRASLFAALKRREVYGTSGPRHLLRFFGGWDYESSLCSSSDLVQTGYDRGVPMGADLPPRGSEESPTFLVMAMKDPAAGATDLQKVQIIKGWVDADGSRREQVYEVAGSADSATAVDPQTCAPAASGFDQLCTVWSDPDFNPREPAFYYARVLESPSCRWTTHQCLQQGIDCADPDSGPLEMRQVCCESRSPGSVFPDNRIDSQIQERSWSSPIWYTP